uniref:NHS-like protein 1 n=1 Tax=Denticeps clupeoides TaxID=299321 RepID=A0AAY4B8K0_9TELE
MPFHPRSVEPRHPCRLNGDGPDASLGDVCCRTLAGVLHQLSDLSRHASDIFLEIETQAGLIWRRSARIQVLVESLQDTVRRSDPKKIPIPVSNLDEESKWTVHYTAPWHQQENVFLPGSRPACVEDLHRQAKVNLKTALRECDKLRKDGFRSSQYYSQGPTFSSPTHYIQPEDEDADDIDKKSTASSMEEEKSSDPMRDQTPVQGMGPGTEDQASWSKGAPLPTPEEKMRQQAQAVLTDVIPINITGETFDRQASVRRSFINTDTVARRPKKVKRRKTISGVPDNVQQELVAKGRGGELRPQSMFIPGQYSTLGRSGSMSSALRRSEKRDSYCQTEEVKIVPPSVRRIRAQRGQGIAAQMSGMSTSTGNISTVTDGTSSPVILMAPHINGDLQRFHSLPRGVRVSLNAEPRYSSTPCKPEDCDTPATSSRQIGKLQVDETAVHLRNMPRTGMQARPKSQEVRGPQGEWGASGPACVVSPHAAYSTSLIPNATMSCSTEVITLHTNVIAVKQPQSSRPLSMVATTNGDLQGIAVSQSTSNMAKHRQIETPDRRVGGTPIKSVESNASLYSQSTVTVGTSSDEQWIYDTAENVVPKRPITSSCSTPINHLYSSLERSSKGTDSSSLYSMDNDGYYTSMHLDSGLRSRSQGSGHGHGIASRAARHSMYECLGQQEDRMSLYSDHSLSRSISLRKCKKPPLPPARTDSLHSKPGRKPTLTDATSENGEPVLNESLIASLQQSLQMGLKGKGMSSSPSQSPSSDYEDPWVLRPRSQSSVSAGSSGILGPGGTNVYSICHVTPSHSETSSLRSDYTDSWGYYMDFPRQQGDQTKSSPNTHSTRSLAGQPSGMSNGSVPYDGSQTSHPPTQDGVTVVKPKTDTSSPDRVHRLTSPSSGYSSQSNTPTAGTPVPSFMRSMSPSGNRPKPRVPERKSSLLSSVSISSSSTSLSSNTSDSVRNSVPPSAPPLPTTSTISLLSPPSFPPPLPPASSLPSTPHQEGAPPVSFSSSTEFPPPPPEVLMDPALSLNQSSLFNPPLPPPPPPLPPSIPSPLPPPPLPSVPSPSAPLQSYQGIAGLQSIKDSLKQVSNSVNTNIISDKDSSRTPMPLITPLALQSVQLRSVKRAEKKENTDSEGNNQFKTPEKLQNTALPIASCSNSNETNPVNQSLSEETYSIPSGPKLCYSKNKEQDPVESQNSPTKQKPPVATKKPKLSLIVPLPQVLSEEKFSTPEELRDSLPNKEGLEAVHMSSAVQEGDLTEPKDSGPEEEGAEDEDGASSTGSMSSKDEDNGEVFESSTTESSPSPNVNGDNRGEMVTPTRQRTTEDLFAAIHRSKRKVLGRRESEEERSRGHSPSPPVTPTGVTAGLTSPLPRQAGSIQRNLRKSATSSDTFKALLLKKGSRSETSFRMSAAEMLRTTDPRFQRTRSLESSLDPSSPVQQAMPDSPCASPSRSKRASEEWARNEGFLPRYSPGFSSPSGLSSPVGRYGRSRTPPSAASSKYNARCRILSSPMTVICEREGELAEIAEYAEEPSPVVPVTTPLLLPQNSNGTLCEEGSR